MTETEAVPMQPLPVKTVGTAYLLWLIFGRANAEIRAGIRIG